jgi:RNA 2',3'-cyclic 3'-phosphodiesterase
MENNTKRLFIGITVPRTIKNTIQMIRTTVDAPDDLIRWISGNNVHLTLSYLGEVSDDRIEALTKSLKSKIDTSSFRLSVEGTGLFPSIERLHTLWLGIDKGRTSILELQDIVDQTVMEFKQKKEEHRFEPHVTIARVSKMKSSISIDLSLFLNALYSPMEFDVNSIHLFESELMLKGTKYTSLVEFPLK